MDSYQYNLNGNFNTLVHRMSMSTTIAAVIKDYSKRDVIIFKLSSYFSCIFVLQAVVDVLFVMLMR